jgi:hypothetical protein
VLPRRHGLAGNTHRARPAPRRLPALTWLASEAANGGDHGDAPPRSAWVQEEVWRCCARTGVLAPRGALERRCERLAGAAGRGQREDALSRLNAACMPTTRRCTTSRRSGLYTGYPTRAHGDDESWDGSGTSPRGDRPRAPARLVDTRPPQPCGRPTFAAWRLGTVWQRCGVIEGCSSINFTS